MAETTNTRQVSLGDIKGRKGLNFDEFNFMDTTIEVVEVKDYTTNPDEEKIRLLVQTEILKEGTKLRATEFLNLFRDEEGNLVYSEGANSKTQKMLEYFKIDSLDKLKGLPCKAVVRVNSKGDRNVGIYYG